MYNAWDDKQLMADFCQENGDDFDMFIAENYSSDYRTSNYEQFELSYCEKNSSEYAEFALKNSEALEGK